ncbi:hypothetical protein [Paracoccus sp. PAR01]|uniref:hypothetical protein n=1 Tax=Paracoccus sp. PAR01 TaxID=2769282 RepID=UPI001785DD8D|nr:hypothetical protein [Paracoccus sp. PAR01]MBD9529477.1 hypothetical protein [Paracoccus sp. PAR01]
MTKNEFAAEDAREMARILRNAKCMQRYDKISHDLLGEILVAAALNGFVEGGNRRGSDVRAPAYGRVEVKSRILGTDGPFPRVSLRPSNLEKADHFVALRWNRDFSFHDAVMNTKEAVMHLYRGKEQHSGMAHITWKDWCGAAGALSLRAEIIGLLNESATA